MDADYNSDEIDMGSPIPNPWAHLGKKTTSKMQQRAQELREHSKLVSHHLTDVSGSLNEQYKRHMWGNRLEDFRTLVLEKE